MPKLKYLNRVTSILKVAVLYPIEPENSFLKKNLYVLWAFLFIGSVLITTIQCVIELFIHPFNLVEENIFIMNTVVYLSVFMNYAIFLYYSKNLTNLVSNINENFIDETDNGVEEVSMKFHGHLTEKMTFMWCTGATSSAIFLALQPLMARLRVMPVAGWFPYDYTKSPFFEISYVWQVWCQANLGIIYSSSDLFYPCMSVIIGQQFKILASNMENAFYKGLLTCGLEKTSILKFKSELYKFNLSELMERYNNIFEVINTKVCEKSVHNYFRKNIEHHVLLLNYCEDLNIVMRLFLLTKMFAAFFNVAFIAFCLVTNGDYSQILGLLSYLFFTQFQVFIYTYSGQILSESSDFLFSLYKSPWYLLNVRLQKIILLVQLRVGNIVYTKAGSLFLMHAPTLISFVRSIFSFVALLKELVATDRLDY